MEIDGQTLALAAIGDLEVTRRGLIMEIQERDKQIAELQKRLAQYEPPGNGELNPEEIAALEARLEEPISGP